METNKIISPYFENGVFAGVRVCVADEDFVIAPKDYNNGKEMDWYHAMAVLKTNGLDTWNYRQIYLTIAYRNEIDKVLEGNGGDCLDDWYWTCTENSERSAFSYYGYNGPLEIDAKHTACCVRIIKNLKKS